MTERRFNESEVAAILFRLPGWARLRRRQMEEIAERLGPVAESRPASDS